MKISSRQVDAQEILSTYRKLDQLDTDQPKPARVETETAAPPPPTAISRTPEGPFLTREEQETLEFLFGEEKPQSAFSQKRLRGLIQVGLMMDIIA